MLNEIENYHYNIRLYMNLLGGVVSFSFAFLRFYHHQYLSSCISLLGGIYFSLVIYLLVSKGEYLWKGRGYALSIPVTMLNTIETYPDFGVYWTYVGVLSIFMLMELKEASIAVIAFILFAFYLIAPLYPMTVLIRIYATLFLVCLFSFLLSYHIERLLIKVNSLVTHDPLTNALNRHTFHTSIEKALKSFIRYQTPATLFIFDLDHFKNINDTYGHQAGDNILKSISGSVLERLRESDQLFRYGGEEFAILLTQTTQEDGLQLAEELRLSIASQNHNSGILVTISGGISQVKEDDQVTSWIERCDKALYDAKAKGRNKVILI